ncbi:putative transporter [Venturia nashicola]|uniref:Putative transporter n=1 Tax=Venturia nashicola TaxID=86259 RepID=A0A4Z1P9E1_9PEZI|nr:putative transporter [Venturia nashicola]
MQFTVAVLALAGSAIVSAHEGHGHEKAVVDPASASLALFAALPTPIANVAITNPAAAATLIQGEFATGTPAWFGQLPPDVQTYFITAAGAAIPAATTPATTPIGTGTGSMANSTATGKYNNGTTAAPTSTAGTTKLSTTAATTAPAGAKKTSTGGASLPTGIVGAGIAGAAGLLAMLAL